MLYLIVGDTTVIVALMMAAVASRIKAAGPRAAAVRPLDVSIAPVGQHALGLPHPRLPPRPCLSPCRTCHQPDMPVTTMFSGRSGMAMSRMEEEGFLMHLQRGIVARCWRWHCWRCCAAALAKAHCRHGLTAPAPCLHNMPTHTWHAATRRPPVANAFLDHGLLVERQDMG